MPAQAKLETVSAPGCEREPASAEAALHEPAQGPTHGPGHGAAWSGRHTVDVRISIPLPFGRWYLTVVAGRERRSPERLVRERGKHPLVTAGNLAFLFVLGTIGGLAGLAAMQFLGAVLLRELGIAHLP